MYVTGIGRDLQLILRTDCTLSLKFGGSLLLGSGTTVGHISISDDGMIEQIDVLLYDAPCFASSLKELSPRF